METVIAPDVIAQSLNNTNSVEERKRKLPSSLVVCLVIAMSLWSSDSMSTVLKNLVNGLSRQWTKLGQYWRVPNSASITEARQRLGCRVMSQLFAQIARPMATCETPGAFLGGLRVMAVEGTVLDVPDSQANARVFGYPASRPGTRAAFPKVRLVLLVEAGTHLTVDALICPYGLGERVRAWRLLRSVREGMLLMWDRGLHSYAMVSATLTQRCHYLGRVPANVKFSVEKVLDDGSYLSWIAPNGKSRKKGCTKIQVRVIEYTIDTHAGEQTYRLITSLMDIAVFPALLLAVAYHQRWERENTIDELKTHLHGRKTPIRSLKPRAVVQEIYGWLLGHYAVRCLMFQAAQQAGVSPLSLGFTGTLKVIRRALPEFQDLQPEQLPFFSPG
ncbi:MAG: IS4 family transposase [Chroococcidiopsidaceae cyanobacterium CP_BM_RX_35]|nr:IS4 family transposase [Chroococcidiopsidaceae cyanobacterium CP_BM_RX_35]